ncbi:flagellar hook-basal body complex protein [Anaplasmataceae bacterium AB001_6]|nr:flagellar hook-basal body complex protein [Anaplasmataceae bacterium AB001_6]
MVSNDLYINVSTQIKNTDAVDVVSNNLANSSTPGFKGDKSAFVELISKKNPEISYGVHAGIYTNNRTGGMQHTGNPLDLALESNNMFFAFITDAGAMYSRNGRLKLDADGTLVSAATELPIMNANAESIKIVLADGPITISSDGEILQSLNNGAQDENTIIDKISIFETQDKMKKTGDNLLTPEGDINITDKSNILRIGYVEESNISPILESKYMLDYSRELEIANNLVKQSNNMSELAIKNIISYNQK